MLNSESFDLWVGDYEEEVRVSDESDTFPFAGYRVMMEEIYRIIMQRRQAKILDIGVGTGALAYRLYAAGHMITGLDFSSEMLVTAQARMPAARMIHGDFSQELPQELAGEKLDFIVSTYALHHLADEQKVKLILSLPQLLAEGGAIIIGDISFETRLDWEKSRLSADENEWDDEEEYFVFAEISEKLKERFQLNYHQLSHCAGLMELFPL